MSEDRAITVISERPSLVPRALAGGVLGTDLGLFIFVTVQHSAEAAVLTLLHTMLAAIGIGAVVALAAAIVQQRRGSLSRLNRDLIHLNSLMERRLINEEDYLVLKQRVIDGYHPQRLNIYSIITPALWAALSISWIPITVEASMVFVPARDFLAAMLLPAAIGAASGVVGTNIIHRLQPPEHHPELPSGEPAEWQALGTRQPLPLPKK